MSKHLSNIKLAVCTLALSLASAGAYSQDIAEFDIVTDKANCTNLHYDQAPLSELSTTTMCQACLSPLIGKGIQYTQQNQLAPIAGDAIGNTVRTIACNTASGGTFSSTYVGLFSAGCQLRHGLFSQPSSGVLVCKFANSCKFDVPATP